MSEKKNAVVAYMKSDNVLQSFAQVLGGERNAGSYISSVLIAVREDHNLMKCEPVSIYTSALRAATLRLSVDPSTGQAYLVPFKNKCTLIVGYKGLYDMAIRTGRYRYIHTTPIYEGEEIVENRINGTMMIGGEGKKSDNIIGWLAYFKMDGRFGGLEKYLYMTVEEIHEHKEKYSKSYKRQSSTWNTETEKMERKTVLTILLRKWGYLDPADQTVLGEMEADDGDYVDAPVVEVSSNGNEQKKSAAQEITELGYEVEEDILDGDFEEEGGEDDTFTTGLVRTKTDLNSLWKEHAGHLALDEIKQIIKNCDDDYSLAYDAVLKEVPPPKEGE